MRPAMEFPVQQLIGKRVVFCQAEDHAVCWHARVGLQGGVVRKVGQTLAQKAALLGAEGIELPDLGEGADEQPRLWVFADPTPLFPQGCETAVEIECLLVVESEAPREPRVGR